LRATSARKGRCMVQNKMPSTLNKIKRESYEKIKKSGQDPFGLAIVPPKKKKKKKKIILGNYK